MFLFVSQSFAKPCDFLNSDYSDEEGRVDFSQASSTSEGSRSSAASVDSRKGLREESYSECDDAPEASLSPRCVKSMQGILFKISRNPKILEKLNSTWENDKERVEKFQMHSNLKSQSGPSSQASVSSKRIEKDRERSLNVRAKIFKSIEFLSETLAHYQRGSSLFKENSATSKRPQIRSVLVDLLKASAGDYELASCLSQREGLGFLKTEELEIFTKGAPKAENTL